MPAVNRYKIDIDKFIYDKKLTTEIISNETGLHENTIRNIIKNKSITITSLLIFEKHYGKLNKYL